jgi:hypothetical protein
MSWFVEALSAPAELGCAVGAGLGVVAAQLSRRLASGLAAGVLAWGGAAAWSRERWGRLGLEDLPLDEWAGHVAAQHGWAMRALFFGALGAAVVLGSAARAGVRDVRATQLLTVAGLCWAAAAFGAPEVALPAGAAAALALFARRSAGMWAASAAWLLAVAAVAGAESRLFKLAALFSLDDLQWMDAALLARAVAGVGAVAAAGAGVRMWLQARSWRGVALLLGLLLALLPVGVAAGQALARGPVYLRVGALPIQRPAVAARMVRGCLVQGEEVRAVEAACPAALPLPKTSPAFFAGVASTDSEALLALFEGGAGEVGVLARMDSGWALEHWRVSAVPVLVRAEPPAEPALRLLPDPVVYTRGMALGPALSQRTARSPRVDVLVPLAEAPTVAELLAVCAEARQAAPGARCVLGAGEIAGYLRPAQPREPVRLELEIIEEDDDQGLL